MDKKGLMKMEFAYLKMQFVHSGTPVWTENYP